MIKEFRAFLGTLFLEIELKKCKKKNLPQYIHVYIFLLFVYKKSCLENKNSLIAHSNPNTYIPQFSGLNSTGNLFSEKSKKPHSSFSWVALNIGFTQGTWSLKIRAKWVDGISTSNEFKDNKFLSASFYKIYILFVPNRRVYSFIWHQRNMKKETDTKTDKSI